MAIYVGCLGVWVCLAIWLLRYAEWLVRKPRAGCPLMMLLIVLVFMVGRVCRRDDCFRPRTK